MSSACRNTTRRPFGDAAVAVVEPVDRGVELVVAAQRLQQQPALGHVQHLHRADREDRPSRLGRERPRVARRVRQHEAAGPVDLLVVRRAAGDHARDRVADRRCSRRGTSDHGMTPTVAERRLGEAADDVDLRPQRVAGRLQRALRRVHRRHGVLDRDPLLDPPVRSCSLRPSTGRISAVPPQTHVRAVELGRDLHRQLGRRIASSVTTVSGAAETKLPPMPDEHLGLAVAQRADRVDGVEAVLARRLEAVTRPARRRGSGRGPSPRCPSCGHPGRWSDRGPGTDRHRACRCCPGRSATLTNSLIVATALRCWVMPIAQQCTVAREAANMSAASSICSRVSPVASRTTSQSSSLSCASPSRRSRSCAAR